MITLFQPPDVERAQELGAFCGHAAFAAFTGRSIGDSMLFFKAGQSWVSFNEMQDALDRVAESNYVSAIQRWPTAIESGLVLLQITGPWTEIGVPMVAAMKHTHWVAVRGGRIFDINAGHWQDFCDWQELIEPRIVQDHHYKATGMGPHRAFVYQKFAARVPQNGGRL